MGQNEKFQSTGEFEEIPEIDDTMLHRDLIDFESHMSALPRISLAISLGCILIFMAQIAQNSLTDVDTLVHIGALDSKRVFDGEYWRLISCMFLHGGFDHLFGNMLMLYVLGMACEHAFGKSQFLVLYMAAGLAGATFSLAGDLPSVGASGAIFGLAGGLIAVFVRHRGKIHLRDHRIGLVIGLWAIYQLALGLINPAVDNRAHIGGLIGGATIGFFLEPTLLHGSNKSKKSKRVQLNLIAIVLALAYCSYHFVPRLFES